MRLRKQRQQYRRYARVNPVWIKTDYRSVRLSAGHSRDDVRDHGYKAAFYASLVFAIAGTALWALGSIIWAVDFLSLLVIFGAAAGLAPLSFIILNFALMVPERFLVNGDFVSPKRLAVICFIIGPIVVQLALILFSLLAAMYNMGLNEGFLVFHLLQDEIWVAAIGASVHAMTTGFLFARQLRSKSIEKILP